MVAIYMVKIPKNVQKMYTISGVGTMYPHHSFSIRYFLLSWCSPVALLLPWCDEKHNNMLKCYVSIFTLETHSYTHSLHTFIDGHGSTVLHLHRRTDEVIILWALISHIEPGLSPVKTCPGCVPVSEWLLPRAAARRLRWWMVRGEAGP